MFPSESSAKTTDVKDARGIRGRYVKAAYYLEVLLSGEVGSRLWMCVSLMISPCTLSCRFPELLKTCDLNVGHLLYI